MEELGGEWASHPLLLTFIDLPVYPIPVGVLSFTPKQERGKPSK